jgi:hypothetical protein
MFMNSLGSSNSLRRKRGGGRNTWVMLWGWRRTSSQEDSWPASWGLEETWQAEKEMTGWRHQGSGSAWDSRLEEAGLRQERMGEIYRRGQGPSWTVAPGDWFDWYYCFTKCMVWTNMGNVYPSLCVPVSWPELWTGAYQVLYQGLHSKGVQRIQLWYILVNYTRSLYFTWRPN